MLLSAVIAIWTTNPSNFVFGAAASHQASIRREHISAVATVLSETGQRRVTYEIDADRQGACLIETTDASAGAEPIRYYLFGANGSHRILYRPDLDQYVEDVYDQRGDFALISSEGKDLDPFISCLVDFDGLTKLFNRYKGTGGWKRQSGKGRVRLSRKIDDAATEFVYNTRSKRITEFAVGQGTSAVSWKFSYSKFQNKPDPRTSDDVFQVKAFDPMLGLATADTPATKKLLEKAVKFYDNPGKLSFEVNEDGARYTIHYSKARAFQEAGAVSWSYDGRTLNLVNANQKTRYSGPADASLMVESVGDAGSRVEPTLYALIIGRNPLRLMLNDNVSVKSGGSGKMDGESIKWLKATSSMYDMDLAVAQTDGHVLQVVTRAKSNDGSVFPASKKTFKRRKPPVTVPVASATSGFRNLSLSQVK